ncbi:autophagy-related protein 13-domain-containing protein [Mycena amicta]|nr:autophagy-related protein 13-domain-containing protein [Mycena amicta]
MAGDTTTKADQIAFHIYTKLWQVVENARIPDQGSQAKTDKWFNLETPITSTIPTLELDAYRVLSAIPNPRPLVIQVVLAVPPAGAGTALVHATRTRIEPEPRFVLLEEWTLACVPSSSSSSSTSSDTSIDDTDILPSTIYKNTIPLFRALFSFLRILPTWRTVLKLGKRRGTGRSLRVMVRLRPDQDDSGLLRFGQSPSPEMAAAPLPTSTHVFPGIAHPAGTLSLSTTYLTTPSFTLESLETLLSSRFAVLDARPRLDSSPPTRMPLADDDDEGFVPTLARRPVSVSTTSFPQVPPSPSRYTSPLPPPLPGTSASPGRYTSVFHARQRTESSLSRDPPSASTSYSHRMGAGAGYKRDTATTDIDRFVLPAESSDSLSHLRGFGAGESSTELSRGAMPSEREREREREKGVPIGGGVSAGLSLGAVGSLPGSAPSPSPINPSMINPFKSNTLSRSSLSGSLLRGVSGSPGRPGVAFPPATIRDSSSSGSTSIPVAVPAQRKRYSSSFSHRYGAAAGSSVGSGGSGESGSASGGGSFGVVAAAAARDRERRPSAGSAQGGFIKSASPMDPQQQDDIDISAFVKDLDAAPPLLGRYHAHELDDDDEEEEEDVPAGHGRTGTGSGSSSPSTDTSRGGTIRGSGSTYPSRTATLGTASTSTSTSAPMLTSASEVDERLRRMNDEFRKSLAGLGSGRGTGTSPRSPAGALFAQSQSHSPGSGSASASASGSVGGGSVGGQGSDEVIGRMEFDFERRGR